MTIAESLCFRKYSAEGIVHLPVNIRSHASLEANIRSCSGRQRREASEIKDLQVSPENLPFQLNTDVE